MTRRGLLRDWLKIPALTQSSWQPCLCHATPGRARKIHRPDSSPGSALPSPACCFASVIVWTENKNCYHIWPLYLFYFDGETALADCVLGATTNKMSSTFLRKKSASGWPGWRIFWPRNDAGAATGVTRPPMKHVPDVVCGTVMSSSFCHRMFFTAQ